MYLEVLSKTLGFALTARGKKNTLALLYLESHIFEIRTPSSKLETISMGPVIVSHLAWTIA